MAEPFRLVHISTMPPFSYSEYQRILARVRLVRTQHLAGLRPRTVMVPYCASPRIRVTMPSATCPNGRPYSLVQVTGSRRQPDRPNIPEQTPRTPSRMCAGRREGTDFDIVAKGNSQTKLMRESGVSRRGREAGPGVSTPSSVRTVTGATRLPFRYGSGSADHPRISEGPQTCWSAAVSSGGMLLGVV
jgi:hypothetical protein